MHPYHQALVFGLAASRVPIDTAKFHQIPGWLLVFVGSVVGAYEVRHLGPRLHSGRDAFAHAMDVFELLLMSATAVALSSTPLGVQFLTFVQSGETSIASGLSGGTLHLGSTVILLAISILLGLWYIRTERLLAAILCGFSILVLGTVSPWADTFLGWIVNTVAAGMWNLTLGIVVFIVGHL